MIYTYLATALRNRRRSGVLLQTHSVAVYRGSFHAPTRDISALVALCLACRDSRSTNLWHYMQVQTNMFSIRTHLSWRCGRARHEYQEPSSEGKTCVKVVVYQHEWKEARHESQSPSFGWRAGKAVCHARHHNRRAFVTMAATLHV